MELFQFALTSSYFLYNEQYYKQQAGMATGSPLSRDLCMEQFEHVILERAPFKLSCFMWYVDDTFTIWPHGIDKLNKFLHFINGLHPNIKFTMEMEKDVGLHFFHVFLCQKGDGSLRQKGLFVN